MRRITFLFIIMTELFSGFTEVKAQVPFTQVNQVPLLLNPSLTGSKEQKRIALGLNNYDLNTQIRHNNFYLSYDQMAKKIGSGIGGYVMHSSYRGRPLPSDYGKKYGSSFSETSLGIIVAPKYRIGSQPQPRYTFSPSLMIGYSYREEENYNHYTQTYGVYYAPYWPVTTADSMKYTIAKTSTRILRSGIGLGLNSESMMILYKATLDFEKSDETDKIISIANNTGEKAEHTYRFRHPIYSLEQSLSLGKSFSLFRKKLIATPIAGFGIRSYLNVSQKSIRERDPRFYYSENLISKTNHVNFAHASLNFRAQKLLFGVAATYTSDYGFYHGATIGFQNSFLKIMSTWNVRKSRISSEFTVNVLF